ncbi:hypothetical protein [Leifsonia shinshuensis]|uniref:hypothetical protein n=1 Tax=Leifsonia shinshuensis TaxID=150026 RepID=UPI00285AB8C6|nr:hypothetical protein [Leifsonia shinshuensis]MDR6971502.1 Tfp pilus assembly protein PilO [Leifsonia shinshuensis]
MNATRLWTIGAIVLAAAILVGGWFLAIQPQISAASDAAAERFTVDQANAVNLAKLAKLKQDYADMPTIDKELASLRRSVPTDTADYPSFMKDLSAAAAADSVTITSITFSDTIPDPGPANGASTPDASGPSTSTATPAPTASPTASPAPAAPGGTAAANAPLLVATPAVVTVKGSWTAVRAFLKSVQTGSRLFLVTGASLLPSDNAAAVEAKVNGYIYTVLPKGSGSTAITAPANK